jgi:predicted Rossmann-fold nucleotide-binding protein
MRAFIQKSLIKEATISKEDLVLWDTTDSPKKAVELIRTGLNSPQVFRKQRRRKVAHQLD